MGLTENTAPQTPNSPDLPVYHHFPIFGPTQIQKFISWLAGFRALETKSPIWLVPATRMKEIHGNPIFPLVKSLF